MSLNDYRWGRHPESDDERSSENPSESPEVKTSGTEEKHGAGEDRAGQSAQPEGSAASENKSGADSVSGRNEDKRSDPGKTQADRTPENSAHDLEAEWKSFNELLQSFKNGRLPERKKKEEPGRGDGRLARRIAGLAALVAVFMAGAYLGAGYYTVPAGKTGALYVTGEFRNTVGSGTHWHMPWPFEKVRIVDTRLARQENVRFSGDTSEGYLVTADGSLVCASAAAQWHVTPEGVRDYLEHTASPAEVIAAAFRRALRQEASDMTVRDIIRGRAELLASEIQNRLQKEADELKLGVKIDSVTVRDVKLPKRAADETENAVALQNRGENEFEKAQRWAAAADVMSMNTARDIRSRSESYKERVTYAAKADSNFISFLKEKGASDTEVEHALERAWNSALSAVVPSADTLAGASSDDIMNVIRRINPADFQKRPEAEKTVTAADIRAEKNRRAYEEKSGKSAAAQSQARGEVSSGSGFDTRETTADRREYFRNRGR